jgi:hypothetical protein
MSLASVACKVCAVCAREVNSFANNVCKMWLQDIPNLQQLWPHDTHPVHDLFASVLLEHGGVEGMLHNFVIMICGTCFKEMFKSSLLPPRFSLANNMWVGSIPWELSQMTMLEQVLVALLYPCVFTYKLYNKTWSSPDQSILQRAM